MRACKRIAEIHFTWSWSRGSSVALDSCNQLQGLTGTKRSDGCSVNRRGSIWLVWLYAGYRYSYTWYMHPFHFQEWTYWYCSSSFYFSKTGWTQKVFKLCNSSLLLMSWEELPAGWMWCLCRGLLSRFQNLIVVTRTSSPQDIFTSQIIPEDFRIGKKWSDWNRTTSAVDDWTFSDQPMQLVSRLLFKSMTWQQDVGSIDQLTAASQQQDQSWNRMESVGWQILTDISW